jgi:hypothetical protein
MDWQQIATLGLAALAGSYLARNAGRSLKAFRSSKGCGAGCGKCVFAPPDRDGSPPPTTRSAHVIALTDIRPATKPPRH